MQASNISQNTRGWPRTNALRAAALLLLGGILFAAPSAVHAMGELSFDQCYGSSEGCVSEAGSELASLSGVALSADGSSVYVTGPDVVAHFLADPTTGTLTYDSCLNDLSTAFCLGDMSAAKPLRDASGIAVDPFHPAVFVAAAQASDVVQLGTLPSGALEYRGCVSDTGTSGACGKTERSVLTTVTGVAVSPDGDALYVSQFGDNPFQGSISHFSVAPEGQIKFEGCVSSDGSGGDCSSAGGSKLLSNTSSIAVRPNDASLYSVSEGGVVSHYSIDPSSRQFTWADCVSDTGSSGACEDAPGSSQPLAEAEQVAVSPDGSSLYVTSNETVSHFVLDASGKLKWEGCASSSAAENCAELLTPGELLQTAEAVAVSPDGRSVYVGSSSSITSFTLGAAGQLAFQACWTNEPTPGCTDLPGKPIEFGDSIAVSPNGASVYLTTSGGALIHFFRALPPPPTAPGGPSNPGPSNPGPSKPGQTSSTGGQAPTAAAIKAGLLAQLSPRGKATKIASLIRRKRYAYPFKALAAGVLTINWYFLAPGARVAGGPSRARKPKPVLFASGHVTFTAPETRTITLNLTGPGRAMLKHRHRLKLTAKGSFKLPGSAAVTALKTFTLAG